MKFEPDPIEDSIDPLTELLLDNSYLTVVQAQRVARHLLDVANDSSSE